MVQMNEICQGSEDGIDVCGVQIGKEQKEMAEVNQTQFFKVELEQENSVKKILEEVYNALTEKGYNPVNQIVGYIMSGDPTYITSHKNARSIIMKAERDELVEEMLTAYIHNNRWDDKTEQE